MKKSILLTASILMMMLMSAFTLTAQTPVKWNASVEMTSQNEGKIILKATIEDGWHVYGFNQSEDGPISTQISMASTKGVKYDGPMRYSPALIKKMDDVFGVMVSYWENSVTFTRKFTLDNVNAAQVTINVNYMACNDSSCMPPKEESFTIKLK